MVHLNGTVCMLLPFGRLRELGVNLLFQVHTVEVATSQLTSLSLSILFCKMDNHICLTGLF